MIQYDRQQKLLDIPPKLTSSELFELKKRAKKLVGLCGLFFPKTAANVCSIPCALLTLGHWHSPFQRWDLLFPPEPRCIFLTASVSRM